MTDPPPRPVDSHAPAWFHRLRERRRYEFLLVALLLHLFVAVLLPDLTVYARIGWPLTMVVLGVFSVGVFTGSGPRARVVQHLSRVAVIAFPLLQFVLTPTPAIMVALSLTYVGFFLVILVAVLRFLLRPGYINADLVSASVCGYLLLVEVGIFVTQALHYSLPHAFHGVDASSFTTVYLDLVYYCCVTVTSIGFGDITPTHHIAKLATSMLGIAGQFYSVVLVGIMIGKYTAALPPKPVDGG